MTTPLIYNSVWGIEFTFGIFLGEIMETFEADRSAASVISSVQMGVTLCVGPFAADLVNAFGCRKMAAAGAVLAAAGIIASGAASNIVVLTMTAGVLTGEFTNSQFTSRQGCFKSGTAFYYHRCAVPLDFDFCCQKSADFAV